MYVLLDTFTCNPLQEVPYESSHRRENDGGQWRVCETYQAVLAAAAMMAIPILLNVLG